MKIKSHFVIVSILGCLLVYSLSTSNIPSAIAVPIQLTQMENNSTSKLLPPKVANAVLSDLSKRYKLPMSKLKVIKYSRENWSNGCLGLPQPEELCTQVIVEGWRVVVSDGSQKWVYRTDNSGRNVRLETPNTTAESSRTPAK